jgi:hypothetical protein
MKHLFLCLTLYCFSPFCLSKEAVIPVAYGQERYEPLWKKSPFTLSSANELVPGGFAEKLALVGLVQIGDKQFASILNRDSKERFFVSSEANKEGIVLEKMEIGSEMKDVVVTLKKGSEISTLRYDQEFIKQSQMQAAPPVAALPAVAPVRPINSPVPRINRAVRPRPILTPKPPEPQNK